MTEKNKYYIPVSCLCSIYRETILSRFIKKKEKLCFYLYGEVGVGKTMLLNFAFDRLKIRKLRQHFNEFMIKFHNFIFFHSYYLYFYDQ